MSIGIQTPDGILKVAGLGSSANIMIGATETADGKSGLVPQPTASDSNKFLKGDGTWSEIEQTNEAGGNTTSFTGTSAEYEAQKNEVEDGTIVNITDDIVDGELLSVSTLNRISNMEDEISSFDEIKVNKNDILTTMEQIEANTDESKLASATVVKELNENLVDKVVTGYISEYEGLGDLAIWKVHSEKLKDNQGIIARVKVSSASVILIGVRLTNKRGRYISMPQASSSLADYRITDTDLVKTVYSGESTSISLT